jgi:acetyltransferase-like isoleucine patch superfamily enzyme
MNQSTADTFISLSTLKPRAIFKLRYGINLGVLRTIYWRLLGMSIGRKTRIPKIFVTWPHQVSIGNNCLLEHHIYFHFDGIYRPGPSIIIGDHAFIGSGCEFNVRCAVRIGNNCLIASGCKFIDHDHNISGTGAFPQIDGAEGDIIIQDNVWLGANVIVLKGITISEGAVVAAGAIVTKSIPSNEIWAGVPAKKVGQRA